MYDAPPRLTKRETEQAKEKGMIKIKVTYERNEYGNDWYYVNDAKPGDMGIEDLLEGLKEMIREEVTLMGAKDGFTITIERGGEK